MFFHYCRKIIHLRLVFCIRRNVCERGSRMLSSEISDITSVQDNIVCEIEPVHFYAWLICIIIVGPYERLSVMSYLNEFSIIDLRQTEMSMHRN